MRGCERRQGLYFWGETVWKCVILSPKDPSCQDYKDKQNTVRLWREIGEAVLCSQDEAMIAAFSPPLLSAAIWSRYKYFCFACFSLLTKFILRWAFLARFVVFRNQESSSAVCTPRNVVLLTCSAVESLMCRQIVCLCTPEVYKYPFCFLYCFGRKWFQWTVYTVKSVTYP